MNTNINTSSQATPQQIGGKVYILAAARTPTGKFNGALKTLSGPQLGAVAIKAAIAKANIPIKTIQDVYMGNVLQANEGQAPARQAALFASLPSSVEAVTINKVCASGLKAVIFAAQNIQLGLAEAQVAGGFESMSRVPYYLPRPAQGPVFGAQTAEDGLIKDGLLDVYNECLMGACADNSARQEGISRKSQDDFAIQSFRRAQKAWTEGRFDEEIAPVTIETKAGKVQIKVDEGYLDLKESKIPSLKPAFVHDGSGTITAASSSSMNDGASAVVLVSDKLAALHSSPSQKLCRIISYADAALHPMDYSLAPAKAISIALKRANLQKEDIALWEVNEAFAAVIKITEKLLGLENTSAKMNVLGGAIALGHPLGSSGSRILTTLVHQLKVGEYGVVGICNGGGAASAMVIQKVERVEGSEDVEKSSKL